jgi:hypothetical protein
MESLTELEFEPLRGHCVAFLRVTWPKMMAGLRPAQRLHSSWSSRTAQSLTQAMGLMGGRRTCSCLGDWDHPGWPKAWGIDA